MSKPSKFKIYSENISNKTDEKFQVHLEKVQFKNK